MSCLNPPANILLVDDEPRNLEVLEGVLQNPELRLVRATDANDALLALLQDDFAVIVLDIQMPGMSGIELAHLIKQRERTQHIPIIFLTAFFQDEQRMLESYEVGAVDYLTKPVNPRVLRSKVAVFVDLFRKTNALRQTNASLGKEVAQRQKAEAALREINNELEARVEARTTALRQARDAAEQAHRAKDDFLAALSHELRTPLSPVLLLASEAESNPAFSPEARNQFATIRKNVELEARLIDDLLDLTRITRNKLPLDLKPRRAHEILSDAIATVRGEIEHKQIALHLDLAASADTVTGDNVRLQQVFWNILKNAVKFTPPAGSITVTTRNPPGSGKIVLAIRDTGIGLTAEEIARVFDAFSQGDHAIGSGSHRFGGLGLGLTIARSLIEHHGGSISAASEGLNRGATFTIELPVTTEAVAAPEPASAASGPAPALAPNATLSASSSSSASPPSPVPAPAVAPHQKILLVEDHEPTRRALEALLQRRRFDVVASASVAEARALAENNKFDLLISDIGLPDGTGFELMAEMKDRHGMRGIALTGYGMEEDIDRSREAGFVVHLTKPVVVQSLEKALAAVPSPALAE